MDSEGRANQFQQVILLVGVTSFSLTKGGAPISVVQPSDSVGGGNNNRLNLTLDTHKCSVPQ